MYSLFVVAPFSVPWYKCRICNDKKNILIWVSDILNLFNFQGIAAICIDET